MKGFLRLAGVLAFLGILACSKGSMYDGTSWYGERVGDPNKTIHLIFEAGGQECSVFKANGQMKEEGVCLYVQWSSHNTFKLLDGHTEYNGTISGEKMSLSANSDGLLTVIVNYELTKKRD